MQRGNKPVGLQLFVTGKVSDDTVVIAVSALSVLLPCALSSVSLLF